MRRDTICEIIRLKRYKMSVYHHSLTRKKEGFVRELRPFENIKMTLFLYNRLSRKKEVFLPLDPACVTLYVCGPTVYGPIHMGNARSIVVFDILFRILKHQFPNVCYVRNITDVDDKIYAEAKKQSISIQTLTEQTIAQFHQDIKQLDVLPVDVEPRATQHISGMIDMIQSLIEKQYAYVAEGHVLFDVTKDPEYGRLSGINTEDMIAGARVEVAPYKRNPQDFVLWKPSGPEEEGWTSPWGQGRPGWHIECSAMSAEYLGPRFDIHGGGADLLFPHHENECAQSRSALGVCGHVRYWIHNGMLIVNGQKMSKSLGNFLCLKDVLKDMPAPVVRWALLSSHYRHELDWSVSLLHQAKQCVDTVSRALEQPCSQPAAIDLDFLAYLLDDVNTPGALNALHLMAKKALHDTAWVRYVKSSAELLGIQVLRPSTDDAERQHIEACIKERNTARAAKDFQKADEIRLSLEKLGVVLEDNADGTHWTKRV
jgi:cysteinyl-tRNA synthetase